jgi:formyl-CoA transferase
MTVASVVALLEAEGLPASPVRTYAESARDPHVLERDMLQTVTLENGRDAPVVGPATKFSRTPVRVRSAAPALGAHADEILAEIGLDEDARARLRADGVV